MTPAATPEALEQAPCFGIIDPDYARVFTVARCLAWSEGYAIMMHGSFTRDLDLIAVPWTEQACEPEHLMRRIAEAADLRPTTDDPGQKPHGRLAWTLLFQGFGDPRFVDLSVMPRATATAEAASLRAERDEAVNKANEEETSAAWDKAMRQVAENEAARLRAEVEAKDKRIAKLEAALEPFARFGDAATPDTALTWAGLLHTLRISTHFRHEHFRSARTALARAATAEEVAR